LVQKAEMVFADQMMEFAHAEDALGENFEAGEIRWVSVLGLMVWNPRRFLHPRSQSSRWTFFSSWGEAEAFHRGRLGSYAAYSEAFVFHH
jgi:hypothetical protein